MKSLIVMTFLSLIVACKGGGDSGSSSGPGTTTVTTTSSATMDQLVIPDGFNFSTLETLTLTVDLGQFANERSFVSLYSDYKDIPLQPIYSSKLMTTELTDGKATLSFTLSNAQLPIIAEVRGLSSNSQSQTVLEFSSNSEVWME
ncbi:hypothetical protein MACH09_39350 [Vibrio sp. MACH09]|uniref:hypothetical protein n=1 Tax=Vibrio sp. MACH09 TaxID=3025122 RepID=UPI00278D4CD6|nr:hypothetical protein [Vibrio sp. MACH09]GLO63427.1 hypothetical protein MACH09_39350 [Vibrio sp. MACH09]